MAPGERSDSQKVGCFASKHTFYEATLPNAVAPMVRTNTPSVEGIEFALSHQNPAKNDSRIKWQSYPPAIYSYRGPHLLLCNASAGPRLRSIQ
jgi:hypothetical protein